MKLTREEALKLHRQMWTDMQKDLGNYPSNDERIDYKRKWCKKHFPNEQIELNCFLCAYVENNSHMCDDCPIDWWGVDCTDVVDYRDSPISEILALPEREVRE